MLTDDAQPSKTTWVVKRKDSKRTSVPVVVPWHTGHAKFRINEKGEGYIVTPEGP